MNEEKEQRVEIINKLITKISSVGRRFFFNKKDGSVAYFKLENNRIYFVDDYTKESIYAYGPKYFGNGFSHGGTMQSLVLEFSEFIRTGKCINGKNGYGGLYCPYWGYLASEMFEIRSFAADIGYLKVGTAGDKSELLEEG